MTSTTPAPERIPSDADASLTLNQARDILCDMEPKLFSLERLGRVVWLAAEGLELAGGSGAGAINEVGEMIEALAKEIREESYAWTALDDDDDNAKQRSM